MAMVKIINNRDNIFVQYKDLLFGEVFEDETGIIYMKTDIVIDTEFANPEFYAIRLGNGKSQKFPMNYFVKKVNCEVHIS